jgi:AcrR family transcriptional regulator
MSTLEHSLIGTETDGRLRIVQAARPLFMDHGYQAVSMQQIADATGIHKATLYHHYRDKDALFTAVVESVLLELHEEVVNEIARHATPAEQLAGMIAQSFARSHTDIGRFLSDAYEHLSPERRKEVFTATRMPWDPVEQIIDKAIARGDLPDIDPGFAVSCFFGLVWGQTWTRKMEWRTAPLDAALASDLVRVLFAGLQTAPPIER